MCASQSFSIIALEMTSFYYIMDRLFNALQIPQQTTKALISLQNGLPNAQWINPQNFHVTLSFFGEIESTTENEIIHAFNTIEPPSFTLQIKGF
ncbi:2'-5' RNA ligase [Bartonella rattimassiliensis 15908]|uniref:2'-5' RNA ligase n=1 Tax=Bartonella rattimassiliensis 15908 TaxID=1094556 RepID=J1JMH3_9HYPH|nr:2'-5' RNA ligase [Bartonella rattimassiliensis 15908]